jgi:hypothetical protein
MALEGHVIRGFGERKPAELRTLTNRTIVRNPGGLVQQAVHF